jgi:hypothetical protein
MKRLFTALAILLVFASNSWAQSLLNSIEKQLTNNNSKQWTLEGTNIFLGDTCINGIYLTFRAQNKTVIKKYCENNHLKIHAFRWELILDSNNLVPLLSFYNNKNMLHEIYKIEFVNRKGKNFLRLREYNKDQIKETIDYYYF